MSTTYLINLPTDLIREVYTYLSFAEQNNLIKTCKSMPKFNIKYRTCKLTTSYTNKKGEIKPVSSYLLSNKEDELPTQLKENFVEIKLYNGNQIYYFILHYDVYKEDKTVLDYLTSLDYSRTTKTFSLILNFSLKKYEWFTFKSLSNKLK